MINNEEMRCLQTGGSAFFNLANQKKELHPMEQLF